MSEIPITISYPPELPVSQRRDDIARALAENQVVIVAGATGSGKTTQLPKILLELGQDSRSATPSRGALPPARSRSGLPRNSARRSVGWSATRCASPTGSGHPLASS